MVQSHSQIKIDQYKALVNRFKNYRFYDEEWINPYQIFDRKDKEKDIDFEEFCQKQVSIPVLNPWNLWYLDLDADILIIGQDWGSVKNLKYVTTHQKEEKNTANENLVIFLRDLGYENISNPYEQNAKSVGLFFTNAILA